MKKIIFIILLFFSVCTHAETHNKSASFFYKFIKEAQKPYRMIHIRGILEGISATYMHENFSFDKNEEDRNLRSNVVICLLTTDPEIIEDIFVKKYLEAEFNDEAFYFEALYETSIEYCIKKESNKNKVM